MLGTLGGYVYLKKGAKEIPQLVDLSDAHFIMVAEGLFYIFDKEESKVLILSEETLDYLHLQTLKDKEFLNKDKFLCARATLK